METEALRRQATLKLWDFQQRFIRPGEWLEKFKREGECWLRYFVNVILNFVYGQEKGSKPFRSDDASTLRQSSDTNWLYD